MAKYLNAVPISSIEFDDSSNPCVNRSVIFAESAVRQILAQNNANGFGILLGRTKEVPGNPPVPPGGLGPILVAKRNERDFLDGDGNLAALPCPDYCGPGDDGEVKI